MQRTKSITSPLLLLAALFISAAPSFATVAITAMTPSVPSPQVIGASIVWTVTATDTNHGQLTFKFNMAPVGKPIAMVKDFNVGTYKAGVYTAQPFAWVPTGPEGTYHIQVVVRDFATGETATKTATYTVNPLVTGATPVIVGTANPLVALFSAPACPSGSQMRASFRPNTPNFTVTNTYYAPCNGSNTMTFEIAGMYPTTQYLVRAQTNTGGTITNGPTLKFTTGSLPGSVPFPTFKVLVPPGSGTDTTETTILWGISQLHNETDYRDMATDLNGKIIWFYNVSDSHPALITTPVVNGGMLFITNDVSWNAVSQGGQVLRQIDLAGNIVKETNSGVIQKQLVALGSKDGGSCTTISKPAPVGSACLDAFHHEFTYLPNGYVAALASVEKIFPPGTQGDTSGLPVDIIGDMIVVMDSNWQVVWYWDAFEWLNTNQAGILGETCAANQAGCPPMFLLGTGIAPLARDWLHANSIYFWPQTNDLIFSMKDQDLVIKIDYNNGAGTGRPLWYMTWQSEGNFSFNNVTMDPWPWFSHQHYAVMVNNGAGPLIMFDNGDTRIAAPPIGLGFPGCQPNDCNSRGMALTVDEGTMTVTPQLMANLGVYSPADGVAQLLSNGNYFFFAGLAITQSGVASQAIEIGGAGQVLNIQGPQGYRGWQLINLYNTN